MRAAIVNELGAPPQPGEWPDAATSYLRTWLFSSDPLPVSLLSNMKGMPSSPVRGNLPAV